jgi:hypothetical protein
MQSIDLDSLMTPPGEATQKVAVAFDDEGSPSVGFIIVGKDSKQFRECERRLMIAGVKKGAQKKKGIDMSTDEGAAGFVDTQQTNEFELAVAVVVDWFGFTSNGAPAAFSADAVRKVFQARPSWREKVSAAIGNEAAFLLPSPTNSASSSGTSSD